MKTLLGLPLWLWVIFALALVGAAGYFIREKVRQVRARRAIDNVISSVAFDELRNVLLPTGTGDQIHINYLLLTQNGLLAIDLFDAHGMIFAGEKMEQWSIFGPKRHFMITNPLPMLYDRVAVVRQFAGDDVPVDGRIVLPGDRYLVRDSTCNKPGESKAPHLDRMVDQLVVTGGAV